MMEIAEQKRSDCEDAIKNDSDVCCAVIHL